MGKLTLKIENLQVDSFATGSGNHRIGTVRGHDTVETEWCTGYGYLTCNVSKRGCQTPNNTCYGTCGCSEGCSQNCETQAPYC
ncbi:MAG TPA: hypothetical protein VGC13_08090 [Longimicrobium sp.]|jgi:hypothetical protein|uniref:hypothetical protein n=1 Tax=Longimicrobium sp. TaxID=2029185 RepID=UPI002ED77354